MILELLAVIVLGGLILSVEAMRRRIVPYDALFFFNLSYFLYFVVAPLHVFFGGAAYTRQSFLYENFGPGDVRTSVWLLVTYMLCLVGYVVIPACRCRLLEWRSHRFAWQWAGVSAVGLGFVGLSLYARSVGGIGTAIAQSSFIREGTYEVAGQFLFAKHLIPLLISGTFVLFATSMDSPTRGGSRRIAGWIVLLAGITVAVGLILGGRRVVLFPMLVGFALLGNVTKKWHIGIGAVLAISGAFFLSVWDVIGWGLRDMDFATHLERRLSILRALYPISVQPIADTYMHWVGVFYQNPPLWGFRDLAFAPLYAMPSAMHAGFTLPSVVAETTIMLRGYTLEQAAGEPPGFHGYLYMSAGSPGLIIGSILYGAILKVVHNVFVPQDRSFGRWLVYLWMTLGVVYFVRHGVLEFVVTERFHWWVSAMLIALFALIFGLKRPSPP